MPDLRLPCWQDYAGLLRQLGQGSETPDVLPGVNELNALLQPDTTTTRGKPIHFVPAEQCPATDYERHIFETGEVSTRARHWHDLFNALVWVRYPRIKAAMNAKHFAEISQGKDRERGPVRDALTLFDESGVVVLSCSVPLLEALAGHKWSELFLTRQSAWRREIKVLVVGHALLEKFLSPYKSMTAQALLVQVSERLLQSDRDDLRKKSDSWLASQITAGQRLNSSRELTPLPLLGIPGWAGLLPGSVQDETWYRDGRVFRPRSDKQHPASIASMEPEFESA